MLMRRRTLLRSGLAGALLAAGGVGRATIAERPVLLRGARLLAMAGVHRNDAGVADLLVRGGRIERIGRSLSAPDAEVIEADGHILMPGFVDTHNHLWLSQMRGLFGRSEATRYFPLVERLGAAFRPEDMRVGTLFGAAGALAAGVTTTLAYCDNIRSPAHADAAIAGLRQAGIRARFLYTSHDGMAADEPVALDHLRNLHDGRDDWSAGGLIDLGLGLRTPRKDAPPAEFARAAHELSVARALGLPISTHISGENGPAQLDALIARGWLGPDMLLVHATGAGPERLARVRERGAGVSLTPITEHRVGYGLTRVNDYLQPLGRVGLGLDGALGGAPDMFPVMRTAHNVQAAGLGELSILPRRLLELATIEGARAIGLADQIGSLEPGKRADLILVDTRSLNMGPADEDSSALLVYSAGSRDVALVMVDGRIVKRGGRMIRLSEHATAQAAAHSLARIRRRAEPAPPSAPY
ncbi:amidohydrolase family protein [Pacificimonas flava]|uniref:amidohydrolase family protein n=1 Tax=Pacificimonas flava TaxID=1234595 RepID=UPI0004B7B0A0|nr:amidohydrolase family protein [Pacificimonas flava]MBB5281768.1 cytosine/adenosine deaminase-related metal-dependent hydrolase [Pacificimonas flava]